MILERSFSSLANQGHGLTSNAAVSDAGWGLALAEEASPVLGGVEDAHDGLFVSPGGFTDDVGLGIRAQEFEDLGMAFGIIGQGVGFSGQIELQRRLGNIQADMEDRRAVWTHTCKDTSCGGCRPPRSGNGSSLEQWADVKRALARSA